MSAANLLRNPARETFDVDQYTKFGMSISKHAHLAQLAAGCTRTPAQALRCGPLHQYWHAPHCQHLTQRAKLPLVAWMWSMSIFSKCSQQGPSCCSLPTGSS